MGILLNIALGVCLTHSALMYQAAGLPLRSDDLLLIYSTMYWISGLVILISSALRNFCRVITTEPFTADLMLDMIEAHQVNHIISVFRNISRDSFSSKFHMFFLFISVQVTCVFSASHSLVLALKSDRLSEADLTKVRAIIYAGSKLALSTALEIAKYLPNGNVFQIYGLSEMAGSVSVGLITSDKTENESVGVLQSNIQAKVVDDDGNQLGENQCGEIFLRPDYGFAGYFNNEEATASSMDEDGFFKTGDIGYFDSDGKLYLVDRNKDMIKYCSSQISPSEIENLLIQHASIKAVCVAGIPDPAVGDLPAAAIIQNDGETTISASEIEQMVAGEKVNLIFQMNFNPIKTIIDHLVFQKILRITSAYAEVFTFWTSSP